MAIAVLGIPSVGTVASGNTAGRPSSPSAGQLYYNTDLSYTEIYVSGSWVTAGAAIPTIPVGSYKTADTTVTSSTTFTNDPHLSLSLTAGTWIVDFRGVANDTAATAFLKVKYSYGGTVSGIGNFWTQCLVVAGAIQASSTGSPLAGTGQQINVSGAGGTYAFQVSGGLIALTSGVLSLQTAQTASSANSNTLHAGSSLTAIKIA